MNRALTWVTADDPPTLIIHSKLVAEKLKKAGVETTRVIKKGAGHGWPGLDKDLIRFADWFDEHLKKPVPGS